jgi:hypothetical protein
MDANAFSLKFQANLYCSGPEYEAVNGDIMNALVCFLHFYNKGSSINGSRTSENG